MSPLSALRGRSPGEMLLAAEALVLLAAFRVALAVVPVRRIVRAITRGLEPAASPGPSEAALGTALRVRWAVQAATRHAPAEFVCFPQALAGYLMLRRRGVASTIVYGVARSAAGVLIAHTWLAIGDRTVLGGEGSDAFMPIERWS